MSRSHDTDRTTGVPLRRYCRERSSVQAVQADMPAVAGEPMRESSRRTLIEAHIAEGNIVAEMREYDAFRELLFAELGREPSPEMRALVQGLKLN